MGIEEYTVESRSQKLERAARLLHTSSWATTYGDRPGKYLREAADLYREAGMTGMADWCERQADGK